MGDAAVLPGNKFPIPPEHQDKVIYSPSADTRGDEAILATLNVHRPVASERNIWAFWDSGLLSMPDWQKRNVCDWVRICGPAWTIRVLDNVPESPNYALKYVPADSVPACFRERTMHGPYVGQHAADFLRGAALYNHGGVWTDVGQILLISFDRICWDKLSDPNSPYTVCAPQMVSVSIGNWFIAARKGDEFIRRWHDCFITIWKDRTTHKGIIDHPLMKGADYVFRIEDATMTKFTADLKVSEGETMEYLAQIWCWMRTVMCEGSATDPSFNGPAYWREHVLLYSAWDENLAAEKFLDFREMGPRLFRALKVRLDADPAGDDYREAHALVWRLLSASSTQKIARGKSMFNTLLVGSLWDMPENKGADREPGTFAELLRYGSVNFKQTRREIAYVPTPPPMTTFKTGVLEP